MEISKYIPPSDEAGKFAPHVKVWGEMAVRFSVWQAVKSAQHRLHLTAFGVGMLAFLAGFGICWLAFVR